MHAGANGSRRAESRFAPTGMLRSTLFGGQAYPTFGAWILKHGNCELETPSRNLDGTLGGKCRSRNPVSGKAFVLGVLFMIPHKD